MGVSIGQVDLGGVPRIAVPLLDDDVQGDIEAVAGLADLVEFRIDGFARRSPDHAREVIGRARAASPEGLALVATVRSAAEGGMWPLADNERAALFEAAVPLVDAVDIELETPIRDRVLGQARRRRCTAIVSYHDLAGTPAAQELEAIFRRGRDCGADLVKVAAAARGPADVVRLLEFTLRHRDDDVVTIAMGTEGVLSRVFFPLAGSRITFAHHRTPSAEGQLPLPVLHAALRQYYSAFDAAARVKEHRRPTR